MRGYFWRNPFLAGVDLPDRLDEFLGWHALKHVATCSGFEGSLNFNIAFRGGQHDETSVQKFVPDRDHRLYAGHIGESDVHQSNIRPMFSKTEDSLLPSRCFAHHPHVGLIIN